MGRGRLASHVPRPIRWGEHTRLSGSNPRPCHASQLTVGALAQELYAFSAPSSITAMGSSIRDNKYDEYVDKITAIHKEYLTIRGAGCNRSKIWQEWNNGRNGPADENRTNLETLLDCANKLIDLLQSPDACHPDDRSRLLLDTKELHKNIQMSLHNLPPRRRTRPVAKPWARKSQRAPYPSSRGPVEESNPDQPHWQDDAAESGSTERTSGQKRKGGGDKTLETEPHEYSRWPTEKRRFTRIEKVPDITYHLTQPLRDWKWEHTPNNDVKVKLFSIGLDHLWDHSPELDTALWRHKPQHIDLGHKEYQKLIREAVRGFYPNCDDGATNVHYIDCRDPGRHGKKNENGINWQHVGQHLDIQKEIARSDQYRKVIHRTTEIVGPYIKPPIGSKEECADGKLITIIYVCLRGNHRSEVPRQHMTTALRLAGVTIVKSCPVTPRPCIARGTTERCVQCEPDLWMEDRLADYAKMIESAVHCMKMTFSSDGRQ